MNMKTLNEFADLLHSKGYKEEIAPYQFLCGDLEIVSFEKDNYTIGLWVYPTDEFRAYLDTLEDGTEYQIDYNNYIVSSCHIESPICNVAGFTDGDTSGITLVEEPDYYNKHTLDLFEYCLSLQTTDLLFHELKIMENRIEQLKWAKENLIPVLNKYDYTAEFDAFFNTENERDSSDQWIDFKHHNGGSLRLGTDCLTGKPDIWADGNDITDKIYGKTSEEVYDILLNEIWKKDELSYGYIYNDDPKETVDTCLNVRAMWFAIRGYGRDDVDFSVIPDRFAKDVERYKEKFGNESKK